MAHILIMPRQGNTVESCVLVEWNITEGQEVGEETVVCSVETDKAAFEVPAGASGTVLKMLCAAGDDVPVLEAIAVIGAPGEDWQAALGASAGAPAQEASQPSSPEPKKSDAVSAVPTQSANAPLTGGSQAPVSPRARNMAAKEALPLELIPQGSGPGGRIIERDVTAALANRPALTAAAKAMGAVSLPQVGSGIGGRVTTADLSSPVASSQPSLGNAPSTVPIKGIRKVIADRMHASLAQTAQLTLQGSAPVSRMQEIRSRLKTSAESFGLSAVTVNDLMLFAVSRVLPRFSYMNAHKIGDALTTFEQVHLGLAVDTPRGLMVPVIRNAQTLSLSQISKEAKRLAASCQNGTVKPDELSGSTFTVTNLGSLGITSFTPILNIPEVAILGICSIELKPIANALSAVPAFEPHIGLSLTIDHEVVDGAPAARFLKALGEAVADIDLWLFNDTKGV